MDISIEDLVKAGKSEVRYNTDLLTAYKRLFSEKFGREPDCAGCTFDYDWNRLINNQNFITREIMSDNTFKLRDNSIIYSYDKKVNETTTRRTRTYGNKMTEQFAEAYLTEGTPEQIAERKKHFKILPKKFQNTEVSETSKFPEKLVDMKAFAIEKGYQEDEFKDITRKADMIAYLEAKELETLDDDDDDDDDDSTIKTVTVGGSDADPNKNAGSSAQ